MAGIHWILLIQAPADGPLGGSRLLTFVNNVAINFASVPTLPEFLAPSSCMYPGWNCWDEWQFYVEPFAKLSPTAAVPFYIPPACMKAPASSHPHGHALFSFKTRKASWRGWCISRRFWCIFPKWPMALGLFSCVCHLGRKVRSSLLPIFKLAGLFSCYCWVVRALYMFWILILCQMLDC